MKNFYGIFCLVASLVCLTRPALSQDGSASSFETPASLRSGRPQQVTTAIDYISTDELARTLYRTLFTTAGSEPTSPTEASRVAKACGFVLLTGLDTTLSPLTATQQSLLSTRLRDLLLAINTEVTPVVEDFQWRAVELMQYSAAYDYYRSIHGPDRLIEARIADFAGNAYTRLDQPIIVRNNLSIKLAAALGYAALVLHGTDEVPDPIVETHFGLAFNCIEETMWGYQSDSTGMYGYSEGPYYFRYAMMSALPFLLALDAAAGEQDLRLGERIYPSLLRLERWQRLFEWIAAIRMPDGTLPVFEDTYAGTWFPELHILPDLRAGSALAGWSEFDRTGRPLQPSSLAAELTRTFDFRPEYLLNISMAKTRSATGLPSVILPDAGYAAFRSGWEARDVYFGLIGKHGRARTHRSPMGSGHKHANETAFLLSANGEHLAIEPAYHSSAMRDSLVYAKNHNVILVDGRGADSVSYGSFLFGSDAYITDTLSCPSGGMLRISTAYQNASIERSAYMLDGRFVVLRDAAASPLQRTYTHQLHGNGLREDGRYTYDATTRTAQWTSGAMRLSARVEAVNALPVQQDASELHAPGYKSFARHSVLRSSVGADQAVFHTILLPHPVSQDVRTTEIKADRHASVLTASVDGWELLSVVASTAQMSRVAHPTLGPVYGNGRAWQCILDPAGRPAFWMLDEGSVIQLASGRIMLSSPMPLSACIATADDHMALSVRNVTARELRVRVPFVPRSVEGSGVASWSVNGPLLHLYLNDDDSDVRIAFSSSPTAVEAASSSVLPCLSAPWPNPANARKGGAVTVQLGLAASGQALLTLVDRLGRTVRSIPVDNSGPALQDVRIEIAGMSAGLYFLRLETSVGVFHQRLLVQ
ncbi:MAG: heparinase II/III family protein [Bacteroidia bacterium]|nr:heparinase II/III family protein [Bacteroidia bacterium]